MKRNFLASGTIAALAMFVAGSALLQSTTASGQTAAAPTPPPGPVLDLINERCSVCHSTADIFAQRKSPDDWGTTVDFMVERGAQLSSDEADKVIDYLSTNFAKAQ